MQFSLRLKGRAALILALGAPSLALADSAADASVSVLPGDCAPATVRIA
jgi:hypothetical protein